MNEDIEVEILFPEELVAHCMATTKRFSSAIAYYCKAAAALGQDETEFGVSGMSVLQVGPIEDAMQLFGVKMEHEIERVDGENLVWFYADISELRKRLEEVERW